MLYFTTRFLCYKRFYFHWFHLWHMLFLKRTNQNFTTGNSNKQTKTGIGFYKKKKNGLSRFPLFFPPTSCFKESRIFHWRPTHCLSGEVCKTYEREGEVGGGLFSLFFFKKSTEQIICCFCCFYQKFHNSCENKHTIWTSNLEPKVLVWKEIYN